MVPPKGLPCPSPSVAFTALEGWRGHALQAPSCHGAGTAPGELRRLCLTLEARFQHGLLP